MESEQPRVILINPKVSKNRSAAPTTEAVREPLSILALGSFIEQRGFSVKLIDTVLCEEVKIQQLLQEFIHENTRPLLIGISVMTAQISHAIELSEYIRSLDTSVPLIWGGVHPTLFPEQTSEDELVTAVVHGRGEAPLLNTGEVGNRIAEIARSVQGVKEVSLAIEWFDPYP